MGILTRIFGRRNQATTQEPEVSNNRRIEEPYEEMSENRRILRRRIGIEDKDGNEISIEERIKDPYHAYLIPPVLVRDVKRELVEKDLSERENVGKMTNRQLYELLSGEKVEVRNEISRSIIINSISTRVRDEVEERRAYESESMSANRKNLLRRIGILDEEGNLLPVEKREYHIQGKSYAPAVPFKEYVSTRMDNEENGSNLNYQNGYGNAPSKFKGFFSKVFHLGRKAA